MGGTPSKGDTTEDYEVKYHQLKSILSKEEIDPELIKSAISNHNGLSYVYAKAAMEGEEAFIGKLCDFTPIPEYAADRIMSNNNLDALKILIKYAPGHYISYVLARAALRGFTAFLEYAIESKMNIDGGTLLHMACEYDKIEFASTLLKFKEETSIDINAKNKDGDTALHKAKYPIAQLLLENMADFRVQNKDGNTPLHLAKQPDLVKCLLEAGADVHATNNHGRTPLHIRCHGNKEFIEILLSYHADIQAKDNEGNTPLHLSSRDRYGVNMTEFLVSFGANIEDVNNEGCTALHLAAGSEYNEKNIEFLLSRGANIDAKDANDNRPLHFISKIKYGYNDSLELLLKYNADINARNKDGFTILHCVLKNNHSRLVEKLITLYGADINIMDNDGRNAIDYLISISSIKIIEGESKPYLRSNIEYRDKEDYIKILKLLIKSGADFKSNIENLMLAIELRDIELLKQVAVSGVDIDSKMNGYTALYIATSRGDDNIVKILIDLGADVNIKNGPHQNIALHIACRNDEYQLFKLLLEAKSDVYAVDINKNTALHASCARKYYMGSEIISTLLDFKIDVNAVNIDGLTALDLYKKNNGYISTQILFVKHGARISSDDATKLLISSVKDGIIGDFSILKKVSGNVNLEDDDGYSLLYHAINFSKDKSRYDCSIGRIKSLLDIGADINWKDGSGKNILELFYNDIHANVAIFLMKSNIEIEREFAVKLLFHYVSLGSNEAVQLLLERGVDIDSQNEKGDTALYHYMVASYYPRFEMIKLLLESGAGNHKNIFSKILIKAVESKNMIFTEFIMSKGVDINQIYDGEVVLCAAYGNGYKEIAQLLLNSGADINISSERGNALSCAYKHYSYSIYGGRQKLEGEFLAAIKKLLLLGAKVEHRIADEMMRDIVSVDNIELLRLAIANSDDMKHAVGAFILACNEGKYEIVKLFISSGVNVNAVDDGPGTALYRACRFDCSGSHFEIVKLLLQSGADVNIDNKYRESMLSRLYNLAISKLLLQYGARFQDGRIGARILEQAIEKRDLELAELVLKAGEIDHEYKTSDYESRDAKMNLLHLVCKRNMIEMVKLLLETGKFDVNQQVVAGKELSWTALHAACEVKNSEMVGLLLENGANPNIRDICNNQTPTALMISINGRDIESVELLIKYKADLEIVISSHYSFIKPFSAFGNYEMVKMLLDRSCDSRNHAELEKLSLAVYDAARENHIKVVKLLLKAGANINVEGQKEIPVLMSVFASNNPDIIELLLKTGISNIDAQALILPYNTILHIAAERGNLPAVKLLIEYGANPYVKNENGDTALQVAEKNHHSKIVQFLSSAEQSFVRKAVTLTQPEIKQTIDGYFKANIDDPKFSVFMQNLITKFGDIENQFGADAEFAIKRMLCLKKSLFIKLFDYNMGFVEKIMYLGVVADEKVVETALKNLGITYFFSKFSHQNITLDGVELPALPPDIMTNIFSHGYSDSEKLVVTGFLGCAE
jgi:ankyrin repeat protein